MQTQDFIRVGFNVINHRYSRFVILFFQHVLFIVLCQDRQDTFLKLLKSLHSKEKQNGKFINLKLYSITLKLYNTSHAIFVFFLSF